MNAFHQLLCTDPDLNQTSERHHLDIVGVCCNDLCNLRQQPSSVCGVDQQPGSLLALGAVLAHVHQPIHDAILE